MFASKSVAEHVARGLAGAFALCAAVLGASSHPWLALLAVPAALVLLRGCPMCWTLGLIETVQARLQGRSPLTTHGDEPSDGRQSTALRRLGAAAGGHPASGERARSGPGLR